MTEPQSPVQEEIDTAGEEIYVAPATDQLADPPTEITVAAEPAQEEDPDQGVPAELDAATLRTMIIELRRDNKYLRVLNMQMMSSVEVLRDHLNNLTGSHNKVVEALNGLSENPQFLNAITAYVIKKADEAEGKTDAAIAKALMPKLTVLHYLEEDFEITENILKCSWNTVPDHPELVELKAYTFIEDKWVRVTEPDTRQHLFMQACSLKLTAVGIPENEEVFIIYNPDGIAAVEGEDTPDAFNGFMDDALNGQGAVGEFNAQVSVTREPTAGAVRFEYSTTVADIEDGQDLAGSYTAAEETPAGEWVAVSLDDALVNLYVETVKAIGGGPGETWYINHL